MKNANICNIPGWDRYKTLAKSLFLLKVATFKPGSKSLSVGRLGSEKD